MPEKIYSFILLVIFISFSISCSTEVNPIPPDFPMDASMTVVSVSPLEGAHYVIGDPISMDVLYEINNFDSYNYEYEIEMRILFDSSIMYYIGHKDLIDSTATITIEGTYYGKFPYMEGEPENPYKIYLILFREGVFDNVIEYIVGDFPTTYIQ